MCDFLKILISSGTKHPRDFHNGVEVNVVIHKGLGKIAEGYSSDEYGSDSDSDGDSESAYEEEDNAKEKNSCGDQERNA